MMLLILALVIAVIGGVYLFKTQHDANARAMLGGSPSFTVHEPEEVEEEDDKEPSVKVIVTYTDGTKETFQNEDGEIEYNDGGGLVIRPDDSHCITISPYAYRKVEEIEQ